MIITERQLRRLIKSYITNSKSNLSELWAGPDKESETKLLSSILKRKTWTASKGLSDSILKIESNPERGEIYIHLTGSKREASDREVACAIENFIKKSSQRLSLKWLVSPCRYDDNNKRKMILIAGI